MRLGRHDGKRDPSPTVPTDHMVPIGSIIQELPPDDHEPLVEANGACFGNGSVTGTARSATSHGDDYWERAMGKAPVRRAVAPKPPVVTSTSGRDSSESESGSDYWDQGPEHRPDPREERPTQPPPPTAAASGAPKAAGALHSVSPDTAPALIERPAMSAAEAAGILPTTVPDTVAFPPVSAASGATPLATCSPAASQPEGAVHGAHVRRDDPRAPAVRGAHVHRDDPLIGEVLGVHVRTDDPLAKASWDVLVTEADAVVASVSGAHVMANDPLAVEVVPAHTKINESLAWVPVVEEPPPAEPAPARPDASGGEPASGGHGAPAEVRSRRWRLVPVAGAVTVLAAGLGAGKAFAYFTASGPGTGHATTGTPANVVLRQATVGTVSSHLVPGGTGDLFETVTNPNSYTVEVTGISQIGGVTVSGGSGGCTNDPSWPGTLGTSGVSVPTNNSFSPITVTSGTHTIDIPNAASMTNASATGCQNATFQIPVTITVRTP